MEKLFFLFTDILLSFSDNPKTCNPFHFCNFIIGDNKIYKYVHDERKDVVNFIKIVEALMQKS